MEMYLLFCALLGLWTGTVASNKGYSPILGFLLGALFGVIALIGYYVLPVKK